MSLVNDALKRAKAAQQQLPTPSTGSPLHFRPVEPTQEAVRRTGGLLLPIVFALIALLGLFFVWQIYQRNNQATPAQARTTTRAAAAASPSAQRPAPRPVETIAPSPSSPPPAAVEPPAPAPVPTPTASAVPAVEPDSVAATNSEPAPSVAAAVEPPKPPPLKLQAIFYSNRPSALVSGRTVFVGDRLGDKRVLSISQEAITLVGGGQTNVLMLPSAY